MNQDALFRLDGATSHDPAVDAWFDEQVPDLGDIARSWFAHMRALGDDVMELIHDGCPVACVGDAAFAYVNVFTRHVNVGFYRGAELDDPARLLEGNGRRMRHVKLRPGLDLDAAALGALLDAAYADIKQRLAVDTPPSR